MHSPTILLSTLLFALVSALPSRPAADDVYRLAAIRGAELKERSAPTASQGHGPVNVAQLLKQHRRTLEKLSSGSHGSQRMVRRKVQANGVEKMKKKRAGTQCPVKTGSSGNPPNTAVAIATTTTSSATPSSSTAPSTSTSTSSPASSSAASSGSMSDWLFPMSVQNSWTTWTGSSSAMSFTDALKPLTAGILPSSSSAPDGSNALVANFPAGTYKYSSANGVGFSFYTQGSHNNVDVTGAKDVIFSYSAYFPAGFDFVKGGKMPGLYGGTSLDEAKSCSGGRQDDRDECFSARLMWRTNGMGEFYNYYPTSVTQGNGYCQTAPMSVCDTVYGDSIGRGAFSWSTGQWTTVAQRVRLNDVGQSNGEQQLWVNGVSIMHLTGLQIVVKEAKIYGIMAQTFFGGSDSSWATPKDQNIWFKDWSLAVTE